MYVVFCIIHTFFTFSSIRYGSCPTLHQTLQYVVFPLNFTIFAITTLSLSKLQIFPGKDWLYRSKYNVTSYIIAGSTFFSCIHTRYSAFRASERLRITYDRSSSTCTTIKTIVKCSSICRLVPIALLCYICPPKSISYPKQTSHSSQTHVVI